MSAEAVSAPLLEMRGVDKAFGGVPALRQARLVIEPGQVHALIGQNGAGKSTLIKVLTGAYARDAGTVRFGGADVAFAAPLESQRAGISTIYQELNLVPQLSLAENIFAGREPTRFGLIAWRRIHEESARILSRFGISVDVMRPLHACNTATQQMTAIARAVSMRARLVIMDEPTSSLDEKEVETLFGVIRQLQADGVSVLFVSHKLDELYAVCDRITVMRDGQTVAERPMQDMGRLELVATMLGKELSVLQGARHPAPDVSAPEVLRVDHLKSGRVQDASLAVRRGEIVGLGGLLGSGRTELARAVFGAERTEAGEIRIHGEQARLEQPADAITRGVAYLPEDRKAEGIVADLSIRENLTLVLLPQLTRLGVVDAKRQLQVTQEFIRRLGIRCTGPEQPVRELSGGNQQKVLLARWLASRIELLLLDEPTRGIDVGAKAEILQLIRGLADEQGLAVLMIASELEELVGASDRVTVLRDGRSVAELQGSELTEAAVMAAMAHASPGEAASG